MNTQPEALRLADELCVPIPHFEAPTSLEAAAAVELRRLHAVNTELVNVLARLVGCIDHGSNDPSSILDEARAAIARATGEQA